MSEMRPNIGAERRLVKLIADKQKPMKNAEAPILAKYKFRVGIITAEKYKYCQYLIFILSGNCWIFVFRIFLLLQLCCFSLFLENIRTMVVLIIPVNAFLK